MRRRTVGKVTPMSDPQYTPDHAGLGRLVLDYLHNLMPVDDLRAATGSDDREEWRLKYWHDPVAFARDHFRWPKKGDSIRWLTPYQQDCLHRLAKNKRLAVYGPRGLGKTRLASVAIAWFYFTRDGETDFKVPVTAGGYRQIEEYLFPEVHSIFRMLRWDRLGRRPLSRRDELMKLSIEGSTGRVFGGAASDPNLIEGGHAPQVLYILDESKAIADGIYDSIEGTGVAAGLDDREMYILSISTPGPKIGRFWQICNREEGFEDWDVRHVTPEEAIRAGRMSEPWARQRARQWGTASPLFMCHVRGEFADAAADGVIPHFWAEAAMARSVVESKEQSPDDEGSKVVMMAVDVSAGGNNETVITVRKGWACTDMIAFQDNDLMKVVRRVRELSRFIKPSAIIVDAVGVGAGVYARLLELEEPVVPYNGGDAATETDISGEMRFLNRRAWAWWHLRELLNPYSPIKLSIPNDKLLLTQLAAVTYQKTQHDLIKIESKAEIERRLKKLNQNATESCSPDRADSLVMLFSDAGNSAFEEAFAAAGLHTNQSLDRLQIQTPGLQVALPDLQTTYRLAQEVAELERERKAAEREAKARPVELQLESLMWGGAHRNHNVNSPWDP